MLLLQKRSRKLNCAERRKERVAEDGKEILQRKFRHLKIAQTMIISMSFFAYYKIPSSMELFYRIAKDVIDVHDPKEFIQDKGTIKKLRRKLNRNLWNKS